MNLFERLKDALSGIQNPRPGKPRGGFGGFTSPQPGGQPAQQPRMRTPFPEGGVGQLRGRLGAPYSEGGDYPLQGNSMGLQGSYPQLQAPRTYWQNTDGVRRDMVNPQLEDDGYYY